MKLIVDSGSSKTHWHLQYDDGTAVDRFTEGMNPHFTSDEGFAQCLHEALEEVRFHGDIYFYGAGCGNEVSRRRYQSLFSEHCSDALVHVDDDMTGACRALLGRKAGLVGILGTGSNACRYDGQCITQRSISTGFILGDEGSGNHIGRCLWKDFWAGRMPADLESAFMQFHQLSLPEFLDRLYRQPAANRFLATAAPFALQHRSEPYMHDLLVRCMREYLQEQVVTLCKKGEHPSLSLTGSVAANFKDELTEAAADTNIAIGQVMAQPMEGLISYHTNEKRKN